mmetsp:Transcript_13353/g.22706  ORF Transcript_13353/g.22706 Transcript_13353/m.22706 type:complete len:114 (+) Transcript_13353:1098-1439(+)
MIDLAFYFKGQVFVYYNMHPQKEFSGGYGESSLCKNSLKTLSSPVFFDYASLSADELSKGGNQFVIIQSLSEQVGKKVIDIVSPLQTFPQQGRIRMADLDIDGYPDLFLSLHV